MLQRGRKSSTALEIARAPLDRVDRLNCPPELSGEEAEVWVAIVNAEAADWFTASTVPLLAQYCRHVIHARRIAAMLEVATSDVDDEGKPTLMMADYDRLLKMQERQSMALASLATKMRLAQQSTTNHRGNKKPSAARKPWEG